MKFVLQRQLSQPFKKASKPLVYSFFNPQVKQTIPNFGIYQKYQFSSKSEAENVIEALNADLQKLSIQPKRILQEDKDLNPIASEFSVESVSPQNPIVPLKSSISEELMQELSGFSAFNSAVKYASMEKFDLAESQFQDVLTTLLQTQDERIDLQLIVMKRLALMMKLQEKNTLLTPLLEDLYFKHLAFHTYKNVEYVKILKNLLTHYCIHDLERGSLFLEMLLESIKAEEIPKAILRDVYLYAGIIHALKGDDFTQSERFFQEAIQLGLNPVSKGIAYNNLGCVTYWNCLKILLDLSELDQSEAERAKTLNSEIMERIQLVAPLFKRAFTTFEFEEAHRQTDQINEKQYITLKKLFDEKLSAFDLTGLKPEDILLKNPMSAVCAMNLGEFLLYSSDINSSSFWLQVSQYSSTKVDCLPRVLRTIVLASTVSMKQKESVEFAEKLLIDCLEYSENYTTFNKVFALDSYSKLLKTQGRNYEADSYLLQSEKIRLNLPYWDERKENIIIPDYDFKF